MLTSEEQAQKFYTYDSVCHSPYMGNASDWLKQISPSAQPIRSITQNWVVTSHQHGKYYSHSSDMASAAGLCSPFSNSHTPFCSPEQDSDAWPRDKRKTKGVIRLPCTQIISLTCIIAARLIICNGFFARGWGGEVSYIRYIGLCGSKGYGFLAVLVWSFGNKTISLLMFTPTVYMP